MTANWGEGFLALFYTAIAFGVYYFLGWEATIGVSLALLFYISHQVTYEVGRDLKALQDDVKLLTMKVESLIPPKNPVPGYMGELPEGLSFDRFGRLIRS